MTVRKSGRLFYGWVIVFAAMAVLAVGVGLQQSFGVFFKPLLSEFGWTRAQAAGAFSLSNILQGLVGVTVGLYANRYGTRTFVVVAGVMLGLSYVLTPQVTALWHLYIFYSLFQGIGRGAYYNPLVACVARWFTQRRGLALGLVLAGGGVGTIFFPILADSLIRRYNWRVSLVVFGIISACILIGAALLIKSSPRDKGLRPYGEKPPNDPGERADPGAASKVTPSEQGMSIGRAMRTSAFWMLVGAGAMGHFAVSTVFVHLVAYATDVNITAAVAATFISVIGVSNIVGKLGMGVFSDRYGIKAALTVCFALAAAAMFWASQASAAWTFYLFAVVFGFAYAGWMPLFPGMAAQLFGLKSMSAVVGFQVLGNQLGGAAGAFFAGYIFDVTESYGLAFILGGGLLLGSLVFNTMIRRPQEKAQVASGPSESGFRELG